MTVRRRVVGAALVAVMLAACSTQDDTVRTLTFQVQGEPEEIAIYRGLVAAYEEEFPDRSVSIVEVSEEEDALAKLSTSFAAGDPPDLFLINFRDYSQFASRGAIEPVGPLLSGAGIDVEDYFEPPVEAFTYDGELQCLPQNVSSLVVYYNTELFRRAGIGRPPSDWTWSRFREIALELTTDDVKGLGLEPRIIRLAPFIWSNGGELVDDPDEPTRFTLDDPATAEAVRFVVDLVRRDGVVPTEEEVAGEDVETRFTTGKVAMFLGSRRDTPKFREVLGLPWDVAPLPQAKMPAGILHSDAYCIARGAADLDAVMSFVSFALGPEGQALTALSGRTVPSLTAVANSRAFLDDGQPPRHAGVFLAGIPHLRRTPVIPTWPQIEDLANEIVTRLFYEPGYTLDDAQRELDEQTGSLFARGSR